MSHEVKSS